MNNLDVDTINAAVVNQVTSSTLTSTNTSFQNLIVTGSLTVTDVDPSQNPLLRIGGNISSSGTGQNLFTGDIKTSGDVIAENYIVKSTVSQITTSFSEGSTIFGDTINDTHQFTGSVLLGTSSLSAGTGSFDHVKATTFEGYGGDLTGIMTLTGFENAVVITDDGSEDITVANMIFITDSTGDVVTWQ